jgi:transposase
MLRLLPMSHWAKDVEVLALRHQLTILQRQLGGAKVRFAPADRALLAALLHRLPRVVLHQIRLVVRPATVLRWHRDLIAARHAHISRPQRVGRPRTVRSVHLLVVRLARENSSWGYRRIHGELLVLGIKVAASTVWEILKDAGIDPAPERSSTTWAAFLRSQAQAILAADFFEVVTLTGQRMHVLAVIEHATGRVRVLGATAQPTAPWVTQAVRNLAMDLQDAASPARFLIRDRDGKYPPLFDTILNDTAITAVLTGVRMPRMNAIMQKVDQNLPPRTARPHPDLEPDPPTPRPSPVRAALQRAQASPRQFQFPTTARATRTDHRSGRHHPPAHPPTRPPRRHHPRIEPPRVSCAPSKLGRM